MSPQSSPSSNQGSTDHGSDFDLIEVAEVSFLQRSASGPVRVWAVAGDDAHIASLGSQVSSANPARELIWNTFEVNGRDGVPCPAGSLDSVYAVAITSADANIADTNCRVSILDVFQHREDADALADQEREIETSVAVIEYPVNRVLFS